MRVRLVNLLMFALVLFRTSGFGQRWFSLRPHPVDGSLQPLERTIFIFWDKGFEDAPEIVRLCARSWEDMNPSWRVVRLDQAGADEVLGDDTPRGLNPTQYSDLLRLRLLERTGGVWADATTLCVRSLDDWLPLVMAQTDLFAFSAPGRDRQIASWFIAARPGAKAPGPWFAALRNYWRTRWFKKPYFAIHYAFELTVRLDAGARAMWRRTPRISADGSHRLQPLLSAMREPSAAELAALRETPVHKLNFREEIDLDALLAVQAAILRPPAEASREGSAAG